LKKAWNINPSFIEKLFKENLWIGDTKEQGMRGVKMNN
jgi:hypothetical protein